MIKLMSDIPSRCNIRKERRQSTPSAPKVAKVYPVRKLSQWNLFVTNSEPRVSNTPMVPFMAMFSTHPPMATFVATVMLRASESHDDEALVSFSCRSAAVSGSIPTASEALPPVPAPESLSDIGSGGVEGLSSNKPCSMAALLAARHPMNMAGIEYSLIERSMIGTTVRCLAPIAARMAPKTGVTVNPKYCTALYHRFMGRMRHGYMKCRSKR